MSGNLALKIDDLDNVATIFANGMKKGFLTTPMLNKNGDNSYCILLPAICAVKANPIASKSVDFPASLSPTIMFRSSLKGIVKS